MESRRLFFDVPHHGNMFALGDGDPLFRGVRSVLNMEETSKRHLFFSSPDDMIEEEFYDEQLPEKKRRLTTDQVHLLEKSFETENKLEPERKTQLAKKLGLQPRQVAVWFQNRRARWKTKTLEKDYDLLKASYDSLLSNCDTISRENNQLKSEVISLTEKLQTKDVTGVVLVTQKTDHVPSLLTNDTNGISVHIAVKAEDYLSSGSGGSAVMDEDSPQFVDSGDSYFPDDYRGCVGPVDCIQSEEDDGSDNGRSYFLNAFVAADQQQHEGNESLGWWVWS
ncbi:hypothetical protein GIB67_004288 [Kingdonia uniflora]|uniref:Homeobox-leucine zipper protein n=1 Tax=Kingdonia uniflora TaxID=39325 RepID=A0A7J7MRC6_9MAGN|nr:hypothetical protein GIB67_004288 [Kingdonia uniflora]